jgi:hypothetical protein
MVIYIKLQRKQLLFPYPKSLGSFEVCLNSAGEQKLRKFINKNLKLQFKIHQQYEEI